MLRLFHQSILALVLIFMGVLPIQGQESISTSLVDSGEVNQLISQLDAGTADERSEAVTSLVKLAGQSARHAEQLLALLPTDKENLPPAIREGLNKVREEVKGLLLHAETSTSIIKLDVKQKPIAEVLKMISEQTGNRLRDNRENFGQDTGDINVTIKLDEVPFWEGIDQLLDKTLMDIYAYGGQGELALIDRAEGRQDRSKGVTYVGPFRFEPLRVVSTQGLRDDAESSIDVHLEISWEPRLEPIVLTQMLDEVEVRDDGGIPVLPLNDQESIDIEVVPGSQAIDLVLPLELSVGIAESLESIKGTMRAVIPGKRHAFRFEDLSKANQPSTQTEGDATVKFEKLFKNNAIWELQMTLNLENAGESLASHRGWVFDNPSYLLTKEGKRIDHVGFETTMQSDTEIGIAYLFDLENPEGGEFYDEQDLAEMAKQEKEKDSTKKKADKKEIDLSRLVWVYTSPTGIRNRPIKYELKEIPLP